MGCNVLPFREHELLSLSSDWCFFCAYSCSTCSTDDSVSDRHSKLPGKKQSVECAE